MGVSVCLIVYMVGGFANPLALRFLDNVSVNREIVKVPESRNQYDSVGKFDD